MHTAAAPVEEVAELTNTLTADICYSDVLIGRLIDRLIDRLKRRENFCFDLRERALRNERLFKPFALICFDRASFE